MQEYTTNAKVIIICTMLGLQAIYILTIRRSKSLDEEFGWQWLIFLCGIHNLTEKLGYVADVVQQETKPMRQEYFWSSTKL